MGGINGDLQYMKYFCTLNPHHSSDVTEATVSPLFKALRDIKEKIQRVSERKDRRGRRKRRGARVGGRKTERRGEWERESD